MPKVTDLGGDFAFNKYSRHFDVQKDNDFVPSFNFNLIT
jgi:hypothetical protein